MPLVNARVHAWLLPNARLHVFDDGHLFLLTRAQETWYRLSALEWDIVTRMTREISARRATAAAGH